MSKLKKGQYLYFKKSKRIEQITKSSNNADSGMIRALCDLQKREKEYSVKYILNSIKDESIILYEENVMTPDKKAELCQNMEK